MESVNLISFRVRFHFVIRKHDLIN